MVAGTDYFSGLDFLFWDGKAEKTTWTYRNIKDYYTLQYIHSGHMHLALDNDKNLVRHEAPFVWLMYKDRYFRYGNEDGAMMGHYYVCFRGPRAEKLVESGLYPLGLEPPVVRIKNPGGYLEKFISLLECLNASPQKLRRAALLLEDLLLTLHEQGEVDPRRSPHSAEILSAAGRVRQNPERQWDFKAEAARARLSYPHFRALFHEQTGLPPLRFLIKCRLQKAEKMLLTSHKSLDEIAGLSGVGDVYYFCRQFKKHYHMSPHKYRLEFR